LATFKAHFQQKRITGIKAQAEHFATHETNFSERSSFNGQHTKITIGKVAVHEQHLAEIASHKRARHEGAVFVFATGQC
jgi:hypothetical protein